MPAEIRLPFNREPAVRSAQDTWRKKLLPVGQIEYKGRMLNFNKPYLEMLAHNFQQGAYDQVPFQLADEKNGHTNDPERTRGEVTGVSVEDDGLWVTVRTTPEGSQVLSSNPKLGVSARIVEEYARSDGQFFPAAIQHVLGTLDPRIPGLGAWEAVALSNAPDMIIDLSAAQFAGEEGGIAMPDLSPDQQARLARLLEIDPGTLDALIDGLADVDAAAGPQPPTASADDEMASAIESMSQADFDALQAEWLADEPQYAGAGAPAALSNSYGLGDVELANYRVAETERQLAVLQRAHDTQAFENEKLRLTRLGVPPYITELARPLLEGTGHVIEMANGQGVDAGLVLRRVLHEFGKVTGELGLDAPVELGSGMDEPDGLSTTAQARDDIVARYRAQTGL